MLATIMSVASAGNLMGLARQMQFMTLTADIEGCPPVYADYTGSLGGFSFDITEYLPDWVNGLSPEAMERYKERVVRKIRLTAEYCHAMEAEGKKAATKILKDNLNLFQHDISGGIDGSGEAEAAFHGTSEKLYSKEYTKKYS